MSPSCFLLWSFSYCPLAPVWQSLFLNSPSVVHPSFFFPVWSELVAVVIASETWVQKKKNSLENKNFPSVGVIWWFPNIPLACVCVNVHAVADSRNWAPSAIRCSFRRTYPFNQLLVNSLTNRLLIFQFFNCFKFNNWPGNLHQLGKQFFFEILFHVVIVVILTQSHRRVAFSM